MIYRPRIGAYTPFLVAAGLLVPVWWRWMCRVHWTQVALLCVTGCTAFIAMILPWALRNYTWTVNPVYPFFSAWFGGWVWPEDASQYLLAQLRVGSSFSLVKIGTQLTGLLTNYLERPTLRFIPLLTPQIGLFDFVAYADAEEFLVVLHLTGWPLLYTYPRREPPAGSSVPPLHGSNPEGDAVHQV
jgi:hypothetical protein